MSNLEIYTGPINTHGEGGVYMHLAGCVLPAAYRVACRGADGDRSGGVIPMAFGRERDALAAKRALERAGLSTRAALLKAGRKEFERIMIEALDW